MNVKRLASLRFILAPLWLPLSEIFSRLELWIISWNPTDLKPCPVSLTALLLTQRSQKQSQKANAIVCITSISLCSRCVIISYLISIVSIWATAQKVENTLFRIPKNGFQVADSFFETIFSLPQPKGTIVEGSDDTYPLPLDGVSKAYFRGFLRVLYPLWVAK